MKRLITALVLLCLILPTVHAATMFYNRYQYQLSDEAVAAATVAEIPPTLSVEEHDIFRLGYAFGYDKANDGVTRSLPISIEPTYIVNLASKKFHKPTCYMVNSILLDNREDLFCDYLEAIERGFTPCGKCLKDGN